MLRRAIVLSAVLLCSASAPRATAAPRAKRAPARFFVMGDGTLSIRSTHNRFRFAGRYRRRDGRYIVSALRRINRVFGTRYRDRAQRVSLRLIEVLSFLRATLHGGAITLSSGYRSPRFNRKLRSKGRTVAKASLHQYGMAADLHIAGVKSLRLWRAAKQHRVGGAGYYRSRWVHVDVGPARSWTQGTANVRSGKSDHNKRIIVVPELDRYRAGETMSLRLARMTAYPLGVARRWVLERAGASGYQPVGQVTPAPPARAGRRAGGSCATYRSLQSLVGFALRLGALAPGRYRLRVRLCGGAWPDMPKEIASRPFEVVR